MSKIEASKMRFANGVLNSYNLFYIAVNKIKNVIPIAFAKKIK